MDGSDIPLKFVYSQYFRGYSERPDPACVKQVEWRSPKRSLTIAGEAP